MVLQCYRIWFSPSSRVSKKQSVFISSTPDIRMVFFNFLLQKGCVLGWTVLANVPITKNITYVKFSHIPALISFRFLQCSPCISHRHQIHKSVCIYLICLISYSEGSKLCPVSFVLCSVEVQIWISSSCLFFASKSSSLKNANEADEFDTTPGGWNFLIKRPKAIA